jgi:hypothetical protein
MITDEPERKEAMQLSLEVSAATCNPQVLNRNIRALKAHI